MWSIANRTPYAAKGTWGRGRDGIHEWIVAVKGTFDIRPDGRLVLADEAPEPLLCPQYHGEAGRSSLRYEADLVGQKPATDIIVNGTAYAPKGHPSTAFLASLRIGQIYKEIKVIGNRRWTRGLFGNISSPEPVVQVPIVYERAYGGFDDSEPEPRQQRMDPRNPVGCGLRKQAEDPLPNFEYPGKSLDKAGPAGFGAIASYWSPRRELSGTYDEAWRQSRFPLLPQDWDLRALLCAPEDQRQATYLQGGELVELTNLTPDGVLRFELPKVGLIYRTEFSMGFGARPLTDTGHLISVIIEPDYPRLILVWSSTLPCRQDGDYLEETVVREVRPH